MTSQPTGPAEPASSPSSASAATSAASASSAASGSSAPSASSASSAFATHDPQAPAASSAPPMQAVPVQLSMPGHMDTVLRAIGLPNSARRQFDFLDDSYEWRRVFSELFGTFLLVLVAAGGGMVNARFGGDVSSRTALVVAPALMVAAIILFMGAVSGAHLNPAVSLAFALRRNFPWKRVPAYVGAQAAGAGANGTPRHTPRGKLSAARSPGCRGGRVGRRCSAPCHCERRRERRRAASRFPADRAESERPPRRVDPGMRPHPARSVRESESRPRRPAAEPSLCAPTWMRSPS